MDLKFDFEDITIVPAALSDVDSRSEILLENLPLFVAPMDTVVDKHNVDVFLNAGYQVCMPRGENVERQNEVFASYGLDEVITLLDANKKLPKRVLIDVANGHMKKLYDAAKRIKTDRPEIILMVGNIANPETYRLYCEIGVDFVRCGIGGGSACLTSVQTGIHYPLGSLISECYQIACQFDNPSKIVADGGLNDFSVLIKAYALGADYCMIGGVISKSIEACGENYILEDGEYKKIKLDEAMQRVSNKMDVYKHFQGMSTKNVQKRWKRSVVKTSEGITKYNLVSYTIGGWTENFVDYLKSSMSYCSKRTLKSFRGNVKYVFITSNALNRFKK